MRSADRRQVPAALLLCLALAGCQGEKKNMPGDAHDQRPYDGIGAAETVRFTGTEPFWGGEVRGRTLRWSTPEKPQGETVTVSRFAGRGGLSYSGAIDGTPFTMAITPGACSDGMSDRRYPFVVTLQLGEQARSGCAWTDRQPAQGEAKAN